MDPGSLRRWLTSKVMSHVSSPVILEKNRRKYEARRTKAGLPHRVEYFHQLDDGYSHLAAQLLEKLAQRYDIELVCHLVAGPTGDNAAEPDLLLKLSRYDACKVAPHYGLEFPEHVAAPDPALVKKASAILAAQTAEKFIQRAAEIGKALWAADGARLGSLALLYGSVPESEAERKTLKGTERRGQLGHYSGAMFFYGEEWYWGVDRLYHLERRLAALGADTQPGEALLLPRPDIEIGQNKDKGSLTLEVFPSLRSPYTAISFDRVVKLARDTGVKLVVRPGLPMVMRGVPATRQKGIYIFKDAAREARAAGVPYGDFYDPIGDPVRRCYSLYPWACEKGKGVELISSFLRAAFAEGVNTNNDKGLKHVVEKAGLDWLQAKSIVGRSGWEESLENNRLAMYEAGLWGVPSFRLLDKNGEQLLALWGQDRLWLFAREIQARLEQAKEVQL